MKRIIIKRLNEKTLIKTRRYISVGSALVIPTGMYFNLLVLTYWGVGVLIAIWYLPILLSGGTK